MNLETGCGHPAFDTTWATSCRLRPQLVIDRPSECEQDVHFLIVELQRRHGASPERGPGPADTKPNRRPIKPSPANGNFLGASVLTRCKPARLSHGGMEHLPRPPFESQRGGGRKPWNIADRCAPRRRATHRSATLRCTSPPLRAPLGQGCFSMKRNGGPAGDSCPSGSPGQSERGIRFGQGIPRCAAPNAKHAKQRDYSAGPLPRNAHRGLRFHGVATRIEGLRTVGVNSPRSLRRLFGLEVGAAFKLALPT
jgi:hypothetical protein